MCHRCKSRPVRPAPPAAPNTATPSASSSQPAKMEVDEDDAASVVSQRSRSSEVGNTSAHASKRSSRRGSPEPLTCDEQVFGEIDMTSLTTKADPPSAARPLEILVRAASMMNPKQFELPSEMEVNIALPGEHLLFPQFATLRYVRMRVVGFFLGSSKTQWWLVKEQKRQEKLPTRKQPHVLDATGCVPLPAKICFVCSR